MPNPNLQVVSSNPTQSHVGSREQLSQQIAQGEWAEMAASLPTNQQLVISQDNKTTYTIHKQNVADPLEQLQMVQAQEAQHAKWKYYMLGGCAVALVIFGFSLGA